MVAEWAKIIEINSVRGVASFEINDPVARAKIEEDLKVAAARSSKLQDEIAASLRNPGRAWSNSRWCARCAPNT